jgi:Mrp family chromosome partitioning ATPase
MLTAPTSAEAEPIRTLRANFEFAVRGAGAKTIIFTSAIGGEGKSTTVANLAVALARAGRRVVLVDYDLRNPGLQRFFRIRNTPGLVDVIVDDADLDRALAEVRMTDAAGHEQKSPNAPSDAGTLEVLPLGQTLQDPDHVRADIVARDVVGPLKSRADYVLIDAGPLLPTGDTIALSEHVDAMVLVIGLNLLPMSALDELSPVLASSPAAELGFVVTSAEETLQPSLHSGASKRGDEPQNGRARANGDGQRKNGIAAAPDAEDRPFAAEY